jgi:S1-C subfamily serine protease
MISGILALAPCQGYWRRTGYCVELAGKMNVSFNRLLTAIMAGCLLAMPNSGAAVAQSDLEPVNCLDEVAGTVQRTLARDCAGRILSEAEAATAQQKRRDYIQGVLSRSPDPQIEGLSLAGLGSGFFVAADGSVVTSHHVIDSCAAVSITPTFGEMKLATSVASDPATDLALLRSNVVPPKVGGLIAGEDPLPTGTVFVLGYPSNGLATIVPTLSLVDIIGREGNTPFGGAIVIRGDIRRGNSGGPLLDSGGNIIGVVFAKINSVNVYRSTGQVVRNVGYALPGDVLEAFLKTQDIDFSLTRHHAPKSAERMLEDARPFLVQVGCWK